MNHQDTKALRETRELLRMVDEATQPDDLPWEDARPFRLPRAIIETARRCLMDRDPTPYTLVIPRTISQDALKIWEAISVCGPEIRMTVEPDQGSKENTVLLFTKAND